ncbi:MAG: hypothetical protein IJF90_03390 [Synergistaceae bacterium]|nr:hypothetical protein [Synergistaceae bacterium]
MSYSIALGNGKVFTGLKANGTCFVSASEVKASDFEGGMSSVVLSGSAGENESNAPYELGRIPRVKFGGVFQADGEYYFYFEQMSESEYALEQTRADVDYVAIMTGVEL